MTVKDRRDTLPVSALSNDGPRRALPGRVDWASVGPFYALDDPSRGIEISEGTADIFAVTEDRWCPLGTRLHHHRVHPGPGLETRRAKGGRRRVAAL